MNSLVEAVKAADGFWPVVGIALIGLYVVAWRWGGEALRLARSNHEKVQAIEQSIVTNHGSKNLGDAVDKLTEKLNRMDQKLDNAKDRDRAMDERLDTLQDEFLKHLKDDEINNAVIIQRLARIDEAAKGV